MTRITVQSSSLAAIGYDPATRTLEVAFKPNRSGCAAVWDYYDVSPDRCAELLSAPSIGASFQSIKTSHEGRKVAIVQPDGTEQLVGDAFLAEVEA